MNRLQRILQTGKVQEKADTGAAAGLLLSVEAVRDLQNLGIENEKRAADFAALIYDIQNILAKMDEVPGGAAIANELRAALDDYLAH